MRTSPKSVLLNFPPLNFFFTDPHDEDDDEEDDPQLHPYK